MSNFRDWVITDESYVGYIFSSLMSGLFELSEEVLEEGRPNRKELQAKNFAYKQKIDKTLFGDEEIGENPLRKLDRMIDDEGGSCPLMPKKVADHMKAVRNFGRMSAENFAQVMMFSPLSANTPFAKHWDNFYVLMMILKHKFPDRVSREEIEEAAKSFKDFKHKLSHTISGWKFDTISYIWSNKEELFRELTALGDAGDDVALIVRLSKITGIQPVKAGFIVQLLWGRGGCIDTHNIDIYSKVFPDMDDAGDFNEKKWSVSKKASEKKRIKAAKDYMRVLEMLNSRGINSERLWAVWVDFVESMYIMITRHGKGYYDYQGGILDPNDDEYSSLRGKTINKMGIGKDGGGVEVPLVTGKFGGGASATHLPMDADDALIRMRDLYTRGDIHKDSSLSSPEQLAARAVKFRRSFDGRSIDQNLGDRPSLLRYFEPALGKDGVNPDHVRHIIHKRINDRRSGVDDEKNKAAEMERIAREREMERERRNPYLVGF